MRQETKIVIYDATNTKPGVELADVWAAGAALYRTTRTIKHLIPALNWEMCRNLLRSYGTVNEVQFWGHGCPGFAFVGGEPFDPAMFTKRDNIRVGTWWFRTCASFHGDVGRSFAVAVADATGARAAGHTHNIGFFQSGLHSVLPGETAYWSPDEGYGGKKPKGSAPWAINTLTCLHSELPTAW